MLLFPDEEVWRTFPGGEDDDKGQERLLSLASEIDFCPWPPNQN